MFHPPPRQPLPHGGDSPSIRCHGRGPLCRHEHPAGILFLLPVHGIRVNRHALPAPSGGGGRRPRSGRVVGVVCLTRKRSVWLRRRRQAVGVIIHLYAATGLLRQRTFPGEVLERWDGGARRPLAHIPPASLILSLLAAWRPPDLDLLIAPCEHAQFAQFGDDNRGHAPVNGNLNPYRLSVLIDPFNSNRA